MAILQPRASAIRMSSQATKLWDHCPAKETVTVLDLKELELDAEETAIVAVVRSFVDREVRPVARELDHTDTYPRLQLTDPPVSPAR